MKKKHLKRQTILLVCFLVFLFFGILCLNFGLDNEKKISLKYKENNDIDYKVYLKDNNFFDEKYIEKGKTYITNLIDYIHIDYHYNLDFNQEVEGKYQYQIMAKIEANRADNEAGNYWTKEYEVTPLKEASIENHSNLSLNQSIDIDYNKYNEILNSFKKEVGISNSEGILKVYLKVKSNMKNEKINAPIENKLTLKLPLSQLAIEATIDMDVNNKEKEITEIIQLDNPIYLGLDILSIIFFLLSITSLTILLRNHSLYKQYNSYDVELNKILNTYDSIIVNTEEEPNIKDYNIIKVKSFEELIDAHSEIRMPINYYRTKDASVFLLLNDKTAWKYSLERNQKRSARG